MSKVSVTVFSIIHVTKHYFYDKNRIKIKNWLFQFGHLKITQTKTNFSGCLFSLFTFNSARRVGSWLTANCCWPDFNFPFFNAIVIN